MPTPAYPGVNFAVAETGTLCLVENEGNGRLSTTAPRLHIAITGVEKVVEKLSDVPPLLEILTKSATGQPITTYFNMISRPRQPDELDGPEAVHLVLLDNGRSRIRVDEELLDTLRCIRCGACINHCPVYVQLGGHAYGTVYPGPIGIALEPQRLGLDKAGTLTSACTMCGACGEVCPVKIPLAQADQSSACRGRQRTAHDHAAARSRKPAQTQRGHDLEALAAAQQPSPFVSSVHPGRNTPARADAGQAGRMDALSQCPQTGLAQPA